jgi:hypothetical protein
MVILFRSGVPPDDDRDVTYLSLNTTTITGMGDPSSLADEFSFELSPLGRLLDQARDTADDGDLVETGKRKVDMRVILLENNINYQVRKRWTLCTWACVELLFSLHFTSLPLSVCFDDQTFMYKMLDRAKVTVDIVFNWNQLHHILCTEDGGKRINYLVRSFTTIR